MTRRTFVTRRDLDFFTVENLTKQIGHGPKFWPLALAKELIDNALDAAESAGVPPQVDVRVGEDDIVVADNGPGLTDFVIEKALDFSVRVSDKAAYVSPSRGQQGNALKTLFAAPCVIGAGAGQVQVESLGKRRTIDVRIDKVDQCPHIAIEEAPGFVKNGTSIKVDSASWMDEAETLSFYKSVRELLARYRGLNPHARFTLCGVGGPETFDARNSGWKKWTPNKPHSAYWYSDEQFTRLLAAHLADDRTSGRITTVREFLAGFSGLKSTQLQKHIAEASGLSLSRLDSLLSEGEIDAERARTLLSLMVKHAKRIEPEQLGVMGRSVVQEAFRPWDIPPEDVTYKSLKGFFDGSTLPVVIEMGFAEAQDTDDTSGSDRVIFGVNFSPALTIPDRNFIYELDKNFIQYNDLVKILVNVTYPDIRFTDLGKGQLELPYAIQNELANMLGQLAKPWKKHKERWYRDRQAEERRRYAPPTKQREVNIKDAAYQVMEAAYLKASGNGLYPANARQIMYAARPQILELTGKEKLDDQYFTQTLLPNFLNERPDLKERWNVVYDARGHFREPHGTEQIGLGTAEVRSYVCGWGRHGAPEHTYGAVLFIEKEGFDALLDQSRVAQEYDLAIMSTKGMSVTASRQLIEALAARNKGIRVLVLHDFDAYGFQIYHTLWNDGRRHVFSTRPDVIDLGLRLEDVISLDLESEPCKFKEEKDPRERLRDYGATEAECDFLVQPSGRGGWVGDRVELNALTSDQFVSWLKTKLDLHGVKKVIPGQELLASRYRDAVRQAYLDQKMAEARRTQPRDDEIDVPADLADQVKDLLEDERYWPWDFAVRGIATSET